MDAEVAAAKAHRRLVDLDRLDRVVDWAKLILIVLLVGMCGWLLRSTQAAQDESDRSRAVIQRVKDGQELDRCEARRIGEYLAAFSDYLGVPVGDPFRRELDDHLRKLADSIRSSDVCAASPVPPTSSTTTTTTTTTLPPPGPVSPSPGRTGSAAPTPTSSSPGVSAAPAPPDPVPSVPATVPVTVTLPVRASTIDAGGRSTLSGSTDERTPHGPRNSDPARNVEPGRLRPDQRRQVRPSS